MELRKLGVVIELRYSWSVGRNVVVVGGLWCHLPVRIFSRGSAAGVAELWWQGMTVAIGIAGISWSFGRRIPTVSLSSGLEATSQPGSRAPSAPGLALFNWRLSAVGFGP